MTPEKHTRSPPFVFLGYYYKIKMSKQCEPVVTELLHPIAEAVGYCSQGKGVGHEGYVCISAFNNKTIKKLIWRSVMMFMNCLCSTPYFKHIKD